MATHVHSEMVTKQLQIMSHRSRPEFEPICGDMAGGLFPGLKNPSPMAWEKLTLNRRDVRL